MATTNTLVVRLLTTSDVANNYQSGQASPLEANAKEQAERAAKVRYMGRQGIQVQLDHVEEAWTCENGQAKIYLDFVYRVTVP